MPAVLLAFGAVLALADPGPNASFSVGLIAKEFLFEPKEVTAGTGEIAFLVKNQGAIEHNLVLVAPTGKTVTLISIIEPGQTMRVTASLSPASIPFTAVCPATRMPGWWRPSACVHSLPFRRAGTNIRGSEQGASR